MMIVMKNNSNKHIREILENKYVNVKQVLKDINLKIEPGEMIGLVGHSGAGKSTLINLVPRFYDATSGQVLVDGLGVGDVGNVVLRDRQHLAEDGILIVVMSLDGYTGQLVAGPDIVSRGFVYVRESDELIEEARQLVDDALQSCLDKGITDWGKLKSTTKDVLGDYVWKKTKRRPMILPIIMEV